MYEWKVDLDLCTNNRFAWNTVLVLLTYSTDKY